MPMRTRLFILAAITLAAGCTRMEDQVELYEIGCPGGDVALTYGAGSIDVEVLSNGDYSATLPDGTEWIRFSSGNLAAEGNGDGSLSLSYDINRSIPRSVVMSLIRGTNTAHITITQEGLLEGGLALMEKGISVPPVGGEARVRANTVLNPSDIECSVSYQERETGWISHIRLVGGFLTMNVSPNLSSSDIRHAVINVKGPACEASLMITQLPSGVETEVLTIPDLKAMLDSDGKLVPDKHYLLEGQVINCHEFGNGAENRNVSADTPDRAWKYRVAYLQDESGVSGIKVTFKDNCTGILGEGDIAQIDLFGLNVLRAEGSYSIDGAPLKAIISSVAGPEVSPRTVPLENITAADLYTLVSIPNVEIPIRKGPYIPLDLRYMNLVTGCPVILRDPNGNSIPMMINVDCTFSRDGSATPRGSGSVSGVLVREYCDNYEWDTAAEEQLKKDGVLGDYITGIGPIGPWQIRPLRKRDIAIGEDNPLTETLYEWAYCDSLGVNLVQTYDPATRTLYPTVPSVANPSTLDAQFYCIGADGNRVDFKLCNDFTHLGPYEYGGVITDVNSGNGIRDFYGRSANWNIWGSTSSIGVIYSGDDWTNSNGSSWQVSGWSQKQYWCAEFPTSELSAANAPLSVSFGTMGCINGLGAPRRWAVEWSLDGEGWSRAANYSVPDFPQTGSKKVWQLPGSKYVSVNLPDDVIGKDRVLVRLIPISNASGSSTAYEGSKSISSSRYNAINYFVIKYKK